MQRAHHLNAMNNDKLTVKYANSIYLLYHKGYYSQEHGRHWLSELAVPTLKSSAWQKTVLTVREIVLKKLEAEVERLPDSDMA